MNNLTAILTLLITLGAGVQTAQAQMSSADRFALFECGVAQLSNNPPDCQSLGQQIEAKYRPAPPPAPVTQAQPTEPQTVSQNQTQIPPSHVQEGQQPPKPSAGPLSTEGMANGRVWLAGSADMRSIYVLGFNEGAAYAKEIVKASNPKTTVPEIVEGVGRFPIADMVKELDILYSRTENVNIPMTIGMLYCRAKLSGRFRDSQLEAAVIAFRMASVPE